MAWRCAAYNTRMAYNALLSCVTRLQIPVPADPSARDGAITRRLLICTGPCCNAKGRARALLDGLSARLKAAGSDGEPLSVHCVKRACLGGCSGEPLARVDPDGTWYHHLTPESVEQIIQAHLLDGQPVDALVFTPPINK